MQTQLQNPAQTPVNPLIPSAPLTVPPESLVGLAEKIGYTAAFVQTVATAALGQNIRSAKQTDEVKLVVALSAELEFCAIAYCGASKTDDLVYDELVVFVIQRFGHLGVREIREAFSLAAAGTFEVDLSTYFGLFTVRLLGLVLSGYNDYRNRVVKELAAIDSDCHAKAVSENRSSTFDPIVWADLRLSKLRSLDAPSFRFCTAFDYQFFLKHGHLQFTDEEKVQAWKDSHRYAYADLCRSSVNSYSLRAQLQRINEGQPDDSYRAKRIVIAQQLIFFRWLFPGLPDEPILSEEPIEH